MHVLNTYKFKMDQINSNREKVATSIFRHSGAVNSVVRGRIWPNFKLIQARVSRKADKSGDTVFPIISILVVVVVGGGGGVQTLKGS